MQILFFEKYLNPTQLKNATRFCLKCDNGSGRFGIFFPTDWKDWIYVKGFSAKTGRDDSLLLYYSDAQDIRVNLWGEIFFKAS